MNDLTLPEFYGIHGALCEYFGYVNIKDHSEPKQLEDDLKNAIILRVPNYITDGPGFVGSLYVVIFGGSPTFNYVVGCSVEIPGSQRHDGISQLKWEVFPQER